MTWGFIIAMTLLGAVTWNGMVYVANKEKPLHDVWKLYVLASSAALLFGSFMYFILIYIKQN